MPVAIPVTQHSWQEQIAKLNVPNSTTLGVDAIIAGILSGDGNVKGYIDSSAVITGPVPFIRAGVTGLFQLGYGTSLPASVPAIVTKVHLQTVVDGKAEWDFDISLSAFASTGVYTRPA